MIFKDEFEHEINGEVFYVETEGYVDIEDGFETKTFTKMYVQDGNDEEIDSSHPYYDELYEEALNRDYEVHDTNFDYYESDINSFLKES